MLSAVYLPVWTLPAAFFAVVQGWLLVADARGRRRRRRERERRRLRQRGWYT